MFKKSIILSSLCLSLLISSDVAKAVFSSDENTDLDAVQAKRKVSQKPIYAAAKKQERDDRQLERAFKRLRLSEVTNTPQRVLFPLTDNPGMDE